MLEDIDGPKIRQYLLVKIVLIKKKNK
jgi:hypothetical protein